MKKRLVAAMALGLAGSLTSTLATAQEEESQSTNAVQVDKILVPVALDRQAEIIAQSRMDDAMDRLNAKYSQDMEDKLNSSVASADF